MRQAARKLFLAVAILAASTQSASAQTATATTARPKKVPTLYGTLGACSNIAPTDNCSESSTFVEIDAATGAVIDVIGPVGYTVNGLAWDRTTKKLYATTSAGDPTFHGLITINPLTGAGTPVDPAVVNYGFGEGKSPVHSLAIDWFGNLYAWYDEFGPGVTDTFVRLNKRTGVGREIPNTGLDTFQNGVAFQSVGPLALLWNIGPVVTDATTGAVTQTAYVLNPLNGKPLITRPLAPPTMAALGDFNPRTLQYYGIQFVAFADPRPASSIVVIDPIRGTTRVLGQSDPSLHTLAFVKP